MSSGAKGALAGAVRPQDQVQTQRAGWPPARAVPCLLLLGCLALGLQELMDGPSAVPRQTVAEPLSAHESTAATHKCLFSRHKAA
ncbi:unnamed protein product [Gadus morhua 'NCC']